VSHVWKLSGSLTLEGARQSNGHLKGELFKGEGEVDGSHADGVFDIESSGSEVEDAGHAGLDEGISDLLGRLGGNCHDSKLDVVIPDQCRHVVHAMDGSTTVFTADCTIA
jgi:hypothetical protein